MSRLDRLVRCFVTRRHLRELGIVPPLFARLRRRRSSAGRPASWHLTILADIDEKQGLISPTAFITGTPLSQGRVVLELRNESGRVQPPAEKPLPAEEPSSILIFPPIPLPEGATAGDVTSWRWRVRLKNERGRVLARWSKRLVSAGALNCEAELDF